MKVGVKRESIMEMGSCEQGEKCYNCGQLVVSYDALVSFQSVLSAKV